MYTNKFKYTSLHLFVLLYVHTYIYIYIYKNNIHCVCFVGKFISNRRSAMNDQKKLV